MKKTVDQDHIEPAQIGQVGGREVRLHEEAGVPAPPDLQVPSR